jgi:hypothetical protein
MLRGARGLEGWDRAYARFCGIMRRRRFLDADGAPRFETHDLLEDAALHLRWRKIGQI